jgi:pimeloyl-[acyl-carrier protein] methyl ester esterase
MLQHEVRGSGPDLVMVHGWGMHAGIWSDWADSLAADFRVHLVELPGHGERNYRVGPQLDDWSAAIAGEVPGEAWWLGWSLGALVALNVARLQPRRVRGLVLVAGTPRFVAAPDWPCAVDAAVFDQFATQLQQAVERTLVRFLSLQVRGAESGGESLRRLRTLLSQRPLPRGQALRDGLRLLQHSDLRHALDSMDRPLYWLFGERDTLVPVAVSERVPGSREVVAGAGHAPFLSHPQVCTALVRGWLLSSVTDSQHAAI